MSVSSSNKKHNHFISYQPPKELEPITEVFTQLDTLWNNINDQVQHTLENLNDNDNVSFTIDDSQKWKSFQVGKTTMKKIEFVNQMNTMQSLSCAMQYFKEKHSDFHVVACHPTTSSGGPKDKSNDLILCDPKKHTYHCVEASFKASHQSHSSKMLKDLHSLRESNPANDPSGVTPLSQKQCYIACSEDSLKALNNLLKEHGYSSNAEVYSCDKVHVIKVTEPLKKYTHQEVEHCQKALR